jgi:Na+-translocating ferredoxin:NAD+ oxidoreductase RnfD subunit
MTMPAPTVRLGSRTLLLGVFLIAVAAIASGITRFGQVVNA